MARKHTSDDLPSPQIEPLDLHDLRDGDALDLVPNADLEGFAFNGLALDDLSLRSATLFQSRLTSVSAPSADLRAARLHEVALERLDVPAIAGARGDWRDVHVQGGRLGSVELYESGLRSLAFSGVKIAYLNLRGAHIEDMSLTDCAIEELDLGSAVAVRVSLTDTRVDRLDVQGATLTHMDLRGAELREISGVAHLRGATISEVQLAQLLPALAASLGILVR